MERFLGILIPLLLLGCSSKESDRVIVKFWAMGNEGENVQKLIPEFERQNPAIKVVVQQIPWIAAHEKLLTAFAGNSLPDMCQLGNTWIPEFSFLGALEPLDQAIAHSSSLSEKNYFDGIWNSNVVDSTVYGVPWYVDTRVLFYRKDILESVGYPSAPRTWAEWLEVSERIVQSGGEKKRYAVFLPTNEWIPMVVLGLESGSTLLRDHATRGDFSGKEFARAFAFLRRFYHHSLAPASMMEVMNVYQGFAEGYFAMYITGPWHIGEFQRRLPSELQGKWATAPLAALSDSLPGVSLPGGSSLVIFKSSRHKVEAWKLIEYFSRPSVQLELYRLTGTLPARREAWSDSSFAGNPLMKAFLTQLQVVRAPAKIPEWEQIAMKIQEYAEVAAQLTRSDREILQALDRDVDRILEKRRWMVENGKVRP